jgi:peptidyl-prolyl cis-trans isomerase B (cyclophilin B)
VAGSKRERQVARAKYERQQARRSAEAEKRRRRTQVIASIIVGTLVIGGFAALATVLRHNSSGTATAAASDSNRTVCLYSPDSGATDKVGLPPVAPSLVPAVRKATLQLTEGTVQVDLLNSKAPCTVNSFTYLAQKNFFDGTPCHRLTTSDTLAVLQCGDPTGKGTGGPGYSFASENLTGATYPAGTVAMANSGTADSNGSQFFLVWRDSQLPASYTPFGTITSGLDVLKKIGAAGVKGGGQDGAPKLPTKLVTVKVAS